MTLSSQRRSHCSSPALQEEGFLVDESPAVFEWFRHVPRATSDPPSNILISTRISCTHSNESTNLIID